MKPTIKADRSNTLHRDGTVSYWNCAKQKWERVKSFMVDEKEKSLMSAKEKKLIDNHSNRHFPV